MSDAVARVEKIVQGKPLETSTMVSVEAPEGVRFMIRSRLMTDKEATAFGLV